ncbi:MAG: YbhB/YbcL family Raf kinase inhibitor-like protein [Chloroflexota bacterium]
MAIELSSPAFANSSPIPRKYTCEGENISPPLAWKNLPEGTRSIALIVEDPDAPSGIRTHWVVFDLPASATGLPEGTLPAATTPQGGRQGINTNKHTGYSGPCPPAGGPHRYFFRISALDCDLTLEPGSTKEAVLSAMRGHILAEGELMGTYKKGQ